MKNRIPKSLVSNSKKICIICEGYEEYDYLNRLKQLNLWNKNYSVKLVNAKGIDKVFSLYQWHFQSDRYDIVLIICDTDMNPHTSFIDILSKVDELHSNCVNRNDIIFFANPCSMQIILNHFKKIILNSNKKSDNADIIKNLTGIKNYDAKENKRNSLFSKINKDNYNIMKNNIYNSNQTFNIIGSTNFIKLTTNLENNNIDWINNILDQI
ncbi:hypothetical protein ACWOAQ_08695 [Helcococcus kunzii]